MKPGRNDPCPCGSGLKFKKCCQDKFAASLENSAKGSTLTPDEVNQLAALFNAGRYVELENRARLLLRQYPDSGVLWKMLGGALQAQGKEYFAVLERAAQLLPDDADLHFVLGNVLLGLGQLDNAVASYRQALKIKPDYIDAHINLGVTHKRLGQLDLAITSYRRALEIKPDSAIAFSKLGVVLQSLGHLDDAVASYRQALAIKPDAADVHNNLGIALRDLGQLDDAEASYRRALAINPDFAEAYSNQGNVLKNLHQLDAALASSRRAVEIKPDLAEAHNNLGEILKEQGRLEEAEACYKRALELQPDLAGALNNLGDILRELGRLDEARDSCMRALELDSGMVEAYINLGIILKELGRTDEAETRFRQALEIKPDDARIHFEFGNLLVNLGKPDVAAEHFNACLKLDPHDSFGARLLLASIGREALPLRASESQLHKLYTDRSQSWDQTQNYFGHELVANALRNHPGLHKGKLDILDAGCGTGLVGERVRDLAGKLDGIDMSSPMLEKAIAKNIYDQTYAVDLVSFMNSHPNSYDAITCAATLIHFGDLIPAFAAAAVTLRDDGLFVFTLFKNIDEHNNHEVWVAQSGNLARGGCFSHSEHYVRRLAESSGFMVENLDTEIHEYHGPNKTLPILGLVVVLRRRPRQGGQVSSVSITIDIRP